MAGRTITLKYAGKCKDCGARLPKGSKAKWYGKGIVYGLDCHGSDNQTTANGRAPEVSYYSTASGDYSSCNCIDYPCCGH